MRYIISGKNIDVTEGLKTAIYDKIGKLEKYFNPPKRIAELGKELLSKLSL